MPASLRILRKDGTRSSIGRLESSSDFPFELIAIRDFNKEERLSSIKWISLWSCSTSRWISYLTLICKSYEEYSKE